MSLITDTWRQLVRRRLWPIAVLLVGALVAVPVLLAKSPAPAPPAPAAPAGQAAASPGDDLAEPVVAMADESSRGRRHVLGARKDPFAPAPQPKPKKTPSSAPQQAGVPATPTPDFGGSHVGGSSSPVTTTPVAGGGGSPVTVTPPSVSPLPPTPSTPPAPKKPKLPAGTLTVNFGTVSDSSDSTLESLQVAKLDALPDPDSPVAIYLGPGRDNRSAVFLVDASVKVEGDGTCKPSAADCQKLVLHKGETEFFNVTDESGQTTQYELDVVDIAGKAKAKASRAHRSRASRAHATRAGVTVARVVRLLQP